MCDPEQGSGWCGVKTTGGEQLLIPFARQRVTAAIARDHPSLTWETKVPADAESRLHTLLLRHVVTVSDPIVANQNEGN